MVDSFHYLIGSGRQPRTPCAELVEVKLTLTLTSTLERRSGCLQFKLLTATTNKVQIQYLLEAD